MVEQQRQRVEHEITALVDKVDRLYLRKMQKKMHLCAASCCDDTESSMDRVQGCVERCNQPVNNSQKFIHSELERTQNRLQRCVMDCNDTIKDKIPPNPSESQIAKYTSEFERCAVKCVDSTIDLLPALFKTMKSVLEKEA